MPNPFDQFDVSQPSVSQQQQPVAQPTASSIEGGTNPFDVFDVATKGTQSAPQTSNKVSNNGQDNTLLNEAKTWANSPTKVDTSDITADKNSSLPTKIGASAALLGRGLVGSSTDMVKGIVGGATDLADRMYDYGNEAPLSGRALQDLTMFSPASAGTAMSGSIAANVASKAGNAVSKVAEEPMLALAADDMPPRVAAKPIPSAKAVLDAGSDAFEKAKAMGATLSPEDSAAAVQDASDAVGKNGLLDPDLHKGSIRLLGRMANDLEDKGSFDWQDIHNYGQLANEWAMKDRNPDGSIGGDAKRLYDLKGSLYSSLGDVDADADLAGGSVQGLDAFDLGKARWAQGSKLSDIEDIMSLAQTKDNPAMAMRSATLRYLDSKNSIGLSDAERSALEGIAKKPGLGGEMLRTAGSRLLNAGSSFAGPLDAVATQFGTYVARDMASKNMLGKLDGVRSIIAARDMPEPRFVSDAPQITKTVSVPPNGFQQPAYDSSIGPEINYNPSQKALPAPREMSYEDMVKSGRVLPPPSEMATRVPAGGFRQGYNPMDLNAPDEAGFQGGVKPGNALPRSEVGQPAGVRRYGTPPKGDAYYNPNNGADVPAGEAVKVPGPRKATGDAYYNPNNGSDVEASPGPQAPWLNNPYQYARGGTINMRKGGAVYSKPKYYPALQKRDK